MVLSLPLLLPPLPRRRSRRQTPGGTPMVLSLPMLLLPLPRRSRRQTPGGTPMVLSPPMLLPPLPRRRRSSRTIGELKTLGYFASIPGRLRLLLAFRSICALFCVLRHLLMPRSACSDILHFGGWWGCFLSFVLVFLSVLCCVRVGLSFARCGACYHVAGGLFVHLCLCAPWLHGLFPFVLALLGSVNV
jgi:hypothetical protein